MFAFGLTMRKFKRSIVSSVGLVIENENHSPMTIQDFSRMGVSFLSDKFFPPKTFLTIMYQNETNQMIQMKIYIKNISKKTEQIFRVGALFVAVESRN